MAADIADVLEAVGVSYAALDLDWLTWTNASGTTRADEHRMMLVNLEAVSSHFLDAGATHFVRARSLRDRHELTSLVAAQAMSVRTVELELSYEEIARRIIADPTEGRRADLARTVTAQQIGSGFADVTMANDRSVRDVTIEILDWLDWLPRLD